MVQITQQLVSWLTQLTQLNQLTQSYGFEALEFGVSAVAIMFLL